MRLGIGQCLVLGVQGAVLVIVDRVVRLVARLPLSGVFAADDRLGARLGGAELKVLVLNDAGVRGFGIGIVDDSVALIVGAGQRFGFKANAAVLKVPRE